MQAIILSKSKLIFSVFILITCFTRLCSAQSIIRGTVLNSHSEPAANASVLLLQSKDSSLVKAMICDKSGTYSFNNTSDGSYLIAASLLGHKQAFSAVFVLDKTSRNAVVATIVLMEEQSLLKEVTVAAKKPLLEQTIDRLIINVENSITSAGNTALEVLERSPGIVVDHQNNAIAMNGKNGVVVMINGKISHMPVAAVVQLLAGMSSGNIEKIELINTPPASLDAEGNAGYINIVLKTNDNLGTNGSFSATAGYGKGWVSRASMNINHRTGKINIYGDLSYSRIKKDFTVTSYSKVSNGGDITETFFQANRVDTTPNLNGRLGIDWQVSKHTVMGALFSGYNNKYSQAEHNTTSIWKNALLDTLIRHTNSEINHWYNYSINANLQHDFSGGSKLVSNLDYIHYSNDQPVNYLSAYYNKSGGSLYDQQFRSGKQTPIGFWVASADYSKKMGKRVSMDAGLKQTFSAFTNNLSFERQQNGWKKDTSLSAAYDLKEDYTAAYASFHLVLNKTTEAKAGLRYEHTNSHLGTAQNKDLIDRHYGNLFPSFFVSHNTGETSAINVSYSRRITRPTFNDLAPVTYYINANTLLTGNPALQPSVSNNFAVGYNRKGWVVSISYSREDGAIAGFQPHSDSLTNKFVLSAENLINKKTGSMVFSLPLRIASWWNMQYNATALWQQVNALYKGAPVRASQINFNINTIQRFTLPKSFAIEVSGFYQSAMLQGLVRVKALGSLDMGLRKKLPGKAGSLLFNATNVLNTSVYRAMIDLPKQNLVNNSRIAFSQPTYKLTYSRSFGKEKLKAKRERVTGAEEERNRVQ